MRRLGWLLACALLAACGATGGERMAAQPAAAQPEVLYLDLITGLRQRGMHRAALAHLDEHERRFGPSPASRLLRGQSLAEVGEDMAALAAFQTITSGPALAAARAGIGTVAGRAGRWDVAYEAFAAAVRLEPTNPRHLNNLGYALLRLGDPAQAEFRLRMAAELDPGSAEIRNNIALLLLATGRRADGERLLLQVPSDEVRAAMRREAELIQTRSERRSS